MIYRRFFFIFFAAFIFLPTLVFAAEEQAEYKYESDCCERKAFYNLCNPTDALDKKKLCLNGFPNHKCYKHSPEIRYKFVSWRCTGLSIKYYEQKNIFLFMLNCLSDYVEGRSPPQFELFK